MTRLQLRAYRYIEGYIARHGVAPTLHEIGDGIAMDDGTPRSKSCIHRLITGLIEQGLVLRIPSAARGLVLTKKRRPGVYVFDDETKALLPLGP